MAASITTPVTQFTRGVGWAAGYEWASFAAVYWRIISPVHTHLTKDCPPLCASMVFLGELGDTSDVWGPEDNLILFFKSAGLGLA